LAARVAALCGAEIINADSRQVYAGLRIGTGWPETQLMRRIPHHGYGIVAPDETYSAGRFVADARRFIVAIEAAGQLPLLVGGTGLYIEALAGTMPLDRAVAARHLRRRVRQEAAVHPQAVLHEWLQSVAPAAARRVMPADTQRTLRALEIALSSRSARPSGAGVSARLAAHAQPLTVSIAVLEVDAATLRERIERRVHHMFDCGLVAEACAVRAAYGNAVALSSLGYAEALALYDGLATRREALDSTIRRTLAYAKRQRTWFRRVSGAVHISAGDSEAAVHALTALARECMPRA
jgi:tRNA dimethylallyltransferase